MPDFGKSQAFLPLPNQFMFDDMIHSLCLTMASTRGYR